MPAWAGKSVSGYTRSDGAYVQGYTRSSPDAYRSNNYGSESRGGSRRDEYSTNSATNKSNTGGYGWRDNDRDGAINAYDRKPESKRGGW
ncbi:MAG: hypothetical protein A2514_12490 [Gammaproteobacteria bacterium RIFOXYD12_FULL_61_37]|nr:MAG: hypothetical protein A2514_12490 [Gammaproteobacteria bacterium RIFOXYD12_FULL_61_37]